jgi:hypothetical protein
VSRQYQKNTKPGQSYDAGAVYAGIQPNPPIQHRPAPCLRFAFRLRARKNAKEHRVVKAAVVGTVPDDHLYGHKFVDKFELARHEEYLSPEVLLEATIERKDCSHE